MTSNVHLIQEFAIFEVSYVVAPTLLSYKLYKLLINTVYELVGRVTASCNFKYITNYIAVCLLMV